jgi:carboxypeptidase C (cathepsin A)
MNKEILKMKKMLGTVILACAMLFGLAPSRFAQEPNKDSNTSAQKPSPEPAPKEQSSVTEHTIRIGGQTIPYKATAATMSLKDDKGETNASLFYIAYTRSDVDDPGKRPIAFIYNGGPGSSSVWLHMGAFGPRRVLTTDAAATPPSPYRLTDNQNCLLDATDLVFLDPVGTGFSHAVGKAIDKDFWGVDQDVRSLAQGIRTYVSRNRRWNSPKFLIGESYGTFRSAALSNYLQSGGDWIYLNGIVMLSTVLNLGKLSFRPGEDLPYILHLPSLAAAAWYHKAVKDRPSDLGVLMEQARQFAMTEYASALLKGAKLSSAEKAEVVKKMSGFTGLSEEYISRANLRVMPYQFEKEFLRSRGLIVGGYDARFTGPSNSLLSEFAEYDPSFTGVGGPFTAAFNRYVREEVKYEPDRDYVILSRQAAGTWDYRRNNAAGAGFPGSPNVEADLTQAMIANPHLRVQINIGIYDLVTPFLEVEHTVDHLDLPENLRNHIQLEYYEAGHMMYSHDEDQAKLKANVAAFIESGSKP